MAMTVPPVPRNNTLIDKITEKINYHWDNWFQALANALNLTTQKITGVTLTTQAATVGPSAFTSTTLSSGLYRITYVALTTQAAAVSSSLSIAFGWTSNGHAYSSTVATITNGTTSTVPSSGVLPIQIDAATSPTYTLTYASSGTPVMQYSFSAELEVLP